MEDVYMQTYTGKYVKPLELEPEDIDINDIAHHLSLICRFNGACREHYSVAQHSILVAHIVPNMYKLAALLHDAAEAYMADVISPVKYSLPELKKIEDGIEVRILAKFNCAITDYITIRKADDIMLATESRDLMAKTQLQPEMWHHTELPLNAIVIPWLQSQAESIFLRMFHTHFKKVEAN